MRAAPLLGLREPEHVIPLSAPMSDSTAALSSPASSAERTRLAGIWPWSPWSIFVLLATGAVALPLAAVLVGLFASDGTAWTALPFATIRT